MLEEYGGAWEGTATELHERLADRDLAALPERPDELTKRLRKIARTGEALAVSSGWRGKDRVLRLRLPGASDHLNGVGGVGGVGGPPELTNATDTTNDNGHLSIGVGDLLDPVMFDEW